MALVKICHENEYCMVKKDEKKKKAEKNPDHLVNFMI